MLIRCDYTFSSYADAWEDSIHISVGSMLARSTVQGMQEPPLVGREEEYSSHIFFMP